jgi:hypothetical protein
MAIKREEVKALLSSWKTVADFVYTDEADESTLSAMLEMERASESPRHSVLLLLYQRYSTKRREREQEEIFGVEKA